VCRMAAYTGPRLPLEIFLNHPPHSLIQQAHAPRETLSATVNADGMGIGWLDAAGRPATYRSTLPAWADPNLEPLGRSLESALWVGNVRSATDPLSNGYTNTQPFIGDDLLFLHNGFMEAFGTALRGRFRRALQSRFEADIHGTTDSEYLFALLRQEAASSDNGLEAALRPTLARVQDWLATADAHALLNLVVAQGARLIGVRHAVGMDCPSLYAHPAHPAFRGGALIASEPLDNHDGWTPIPPHHTFTLEPGADAVSPIPL